MLFLRLSKYQQQQWNSCAPVKPYTDRRFELSVSVADVEIISYQLWAMQNYFDNFIYQKDLKIYFFDDMA